MDSHAVTDSSADTIRFLDLFRIPVSPAEFDHSIKNIHFSSRFHQGFIPFSSFFSINSSHFSPRSPRIGAARPEMLIQIFVHFDKENPEGIWTLVDYERSLGCGVWVGRRRPWNQHGLGDGLGDGVGPKCCCEMLWAFDEFLEDCTCKTVWKLLQYH